MKHCLIWITLLLATFFQLSFCCWGPGSTKYGDTTPDFDLQVGSDLVVDCSLNDFNLPKISTPVNSSFLVFKKDNNNHLLSPYVRRVNPLTAQLKIPRAQVNDSGLYHCQIALPDNSKHLVCSTNVYIGSPPQNVKNFNCISRNFDNLTCTWDIEPNNVRTNYTLQKTFLFQGTLQNCPEPNNHTYCQWRDDTEPPYETINKKLTFVIQGNNSLGEMRNQFSYDHFTIVIPNPPEKISPVSIGKDFLSIEWDPPKMRRIINKPSLYYQLQLEEAEQNYKNRIIIDAGINIFEYTFSGLVPHFQYKVSVRCRSNYTSDELMWSKAVSLIVATEADVPYQVPQIHSEAYVIHNFGSYRNVTLYWKPVQKRFYNGDDFRYYVTFYPNSTPPTNENKSVISSTPFVKIGHLRNDTSYTFHIHSANSEGISKEFGTMFIDKRKKLIPPLKDIRAISHELGYYNLSWSSMANSDHQTMTVFWCAGRKPNQCDESIHWSETITEGNSFAVEILDPNSNFQFAISVRNNQSTSGMQWASCIVPSKAPLGQIPITHVEPTSTTLRVIWKLDCEAQKSVIDRYVITYCEHTNNCGDVIVHSDVQSYMLKDLHPFTNYSIKLHAFNKENKPSEDTDSMFQTTLSGGPSDPPQNVTLFSKSNSSLVMRWSPPQEANGIITHYFLYRNDYKHYLKDDSSCHVCYFEIMDLKPYSIYNISVEACNGMFCSPRTSPLTLLTDIGGPGTMAPPRVESVNETHLKVSWDPPAGPNGPIDFYEVLWHQEDGDGTGNEIVSGSASLSTLVEFSCSNLLEGGVPYLFYVRAANVKAGQKLVGQFSESSKAIACIMSQGLAMIIGVAIGGTLVLAFFLVFVYRLVKWMSEKIHQVKNIAVRLPKELEGPDTNPLNNFERFKKAPAFHQQKDHKLLHNLQENKNRHGSGSSELSNVSAEELIFKNGKCTKFGRKPSGDSSGCSSMSSNTTRMHLSSDSGTESDFILAASPDSELHLKTPMPILMEALDSPDPTFKYNTLPCCLTSNDCKHPYSKFGITTTLPFNMNPLKFSNYNLANSEPSVFNAFCSKSVNPLGCSPYAKFGVAKSSGSILAGDAGYSKFGFLQRQRYGIDVEKLNSVVNKILKKNAVLNEPSGVYNSINLQTVGKSSKTTSSGYVTCGDIRSLPKMSDLNISTTSIDIETPLFDPKELKSGVAEIDPIVHSLEHHPKDNNTSEVDPLQLIDPKVLDGLLVQPEVNAFHSFSNLDDDFQVSPLYNRSSEQCELVIQQPDSILSGDHYVNEKPMTSISTPGEIVLTPATIRNGYVPFPILPQYPDRSVPKDTNMPVYPGSAYTSVDKNYITSSNKGELKLLQDSMVSAISHPYAPQYKYVLKPLPRMETEICEV